jgi:ribonuclease HI
LDSDSIEFYTDGSLMDGAAGAGVYEESLLTEMKIPVFQAEIYAIYTATNLALQKGWTNRTIYFHSDSQAAIRALLSSRITSKLVQKCNQVLNRLGRNNRVVVDWVPGHSSIPGNERADSLARDAVLLPRDGFPRAVSWSYSLLKYRMSERLRQNHQQYWINRVDCRQSKLFLQGPSKNQTNFLLSLKRQELRLLVSVVTGHCTLNNHMKTMRLANSPTCAKCLEEDETLEHFVCRCPIFSRVRRRTLGDFELRSDELISADFKSLLSFIKAKI